MAVGDQADGEAEECFVDVVASFPADPQAAEAVQPGDRPLDDPAEGAQAGAVRLSPLDGAVPTDVRNWQGLPGPESSATAY